MRKCATCLIPEREKARRNEAGLPFNRLAIRAWTLIISALIVASPLFRHHFGELFGDSPSESGRAEMHRKKGAVGTSIQMTFLLK